MARAQDGPPILNVGQGNIQTSTQPPPPPPGPVLEVPQPPAPEVLNNVLLAIKTAREARKFFTSWKLWKHVGPAGEVVIKAAVIYRGVAVACMDFDPLTGDVLPKGYHPINYEARLSLDDIRKELPAIIANLKVLDGAEFRDKERCWIVPLAYEGKIVAHVKVYHDGVHIVPDYPVDQEMRAYGS